MKKKQQQQQQLVVEFIPNTFSVISRASALVLICLMNASRYCSILISSKKSNKSTKQNDQ
jgi:hypothetical protein